MNRRHLSLPITLFVALVLAALVVAAIRAPGASANNTYQTLPFSQNWANTTQFTTDDSWAGVPGIIGYSGSDGNSTGTPGLDPCTLTEQPLGSQAVSVGRLHPSSINDVAVAQFVPGVGSEVTDPIVGIRPQTIFDAPSLVIHLNASTATNINVQYDLIDIDGAYSAVSKVALMFRAGSTGAWTNVPAGCVLDATDDAPQKGKVTHVNATLPAAANNQSQLQLRIMSYNANGSDEWIGVDNISITGTVGGTPQPPALNIRLFIPSTSR